MPLIDMSNTDTDELVHKLREFANNSGRYAFYDDELMPLSMSITRDEAIALLARLS